MDDYVYQPLRQPRHIRLLRLEPGTGDTHFSLEAADLDGDLDYEAISYCWGNPKNTQAVYCDGHPFQVTVSLYSALKQLRLVDQHRTLWADAICIDQKNLDEKSTQIQLMGEIYAKPSRILIWLGDDTTGLEGVEQSIAQAMEILPPLAFDADEICDRSQKIFKEASVGSLFYSLHDERLWLTRVCNRLFVKRVNPASIATTGIPSTTSSADRGLSVSGLSKSFLRPMTKFPGS